MWLSDNRTPEQFRNNSPVNRGRLDTADWLIPASLLDWPDPCLKTCSTRTCSTRALAMAGTGGWLLRVLAVLQLAAAAAAAAAAENHRVHCDGTEDLAECIAPSDAPNDGDKGALRKACQEPYYKANCKNLCGT